MPWRVVRHSDERPGVQDLQCCKHYDPGAVDQADREAVQTCLASATQLPLPH
jgi:hypothetical protein